jgi:hypothetical protein
MALVKDYQGTEYDAATILKLSQQITASIDPKAIRGGVFSTKGESIGFNYDEATQLMGRPPTATEQVVLDMARYFAKEGVTDLKDADLTETNRRFGSTFTGGGGTIYEAKRDAEGNPVISTWSKDTSDKKTILSGLAIAAAVFGIPGVTEGLLGSAPAGATVGAVSTEAIAGEALLETGLLSGGGGAATGTLGSTALGMGGGTGITAGAGGLGLTGTVGGLGAGTGAGITAGAGLTGTGILTGSTLGTTLLGTGANALTGTGILTGSDLGTSLLGTGTGSGVTGALSTGVGLDALGTGALTTGVGTGVGTTLSGVGTGVGTNVGTDVGTDLGTKIGTKLVGDLVTSGLTTGAGLLQQQTSREAAQKAQTSLDAEIKAAKLAAQFKPIGMTTRFGTSNFGFDPVTGQLTSAGYTLSPEAKNAQDRFVKLAESGLQQAEGAEALFAPLKTGAASLFSLGQGYLAKTPEQVASDYLKGQMSLLQPGREMELANLQNKLFQQGRSGVAVAQGGTYGDTTPELQALYNARARQEAELAASAQRAGQQDVLFGAGLLGQGSTALGNYYAGQTAAYSPYKTALGEVQNLETLGQQPLTMGIGLGEKVAQAGYNVGRLGLQGAGQSVALATGADATRNPAASAIGGLSSNPLFTSALAKLAGGTPVNALDFGAYGTGDTGFQKFLEETYG